MCLQLSGNAYGYLRVKYLFHYRSPHVSDCWLEKNDYVLIVFLRGTPSTAVNRNVLVNFVTQNTTRYCILKRTRRLTLVLMVLTCSTITSSTGALTANARGALGNGPALLATTVVTVKDGYGLDRKCIEQY